MSEGPGRLTDKAVQLAHDFLSALFMGVRTAQIHDAANAAFENVVHRVHQSATDLFASVGTFEIKVVEESFFLNGVPLRFHGKTYASMRSLRRILHSQETGGFCMRNVPTYGAIRKLISVFATGEQDGRQALDEVDIGLFGTQAVADSKDPAQVDRRVFAVHAYAKLILGLREHAALIEHAKNHGASEHVRARIRVVRVIQDLAELCDERLDLLLKLACNSMGAAPDELAAANACVLSLALGHALELHRRDIGDIGMAALFCTLGKRALPDPNCPASAINAAGLARLLSESGVGQGLYTRSMVLSEQVVRANSSVEGMRRAHPFSRMVRVAIAYAKLTTGVDAPGGAPVSPLDAMRTLASDRSGWLDPRFVDLLINLLRAFPQGTPVVLSTGHPALVSKPNLETFDAPQVRVATNPPAMLDLDPRANPSSQIAFTQMFLGTAPAQGGVVASSPATQHARREGFETVPSQPRLNSPQSAEPTQVAMPSLSELAALPAPAVSPASAATTIPPSAYEQGIPPPFAVHGVRTPATHAPTQVDLPVAHPLHDDLELDGPADEINILAPLGEEGGAYDPPLEDRLLGTYLGGKYRILKKIGEGGMGTVYLANQEPIDRKVAVKVLLPSLASDEVAVQRFELEAKAISRMRHPNTVTIYDFGKTASQELYIVMEYLEGETLADIVQRDGAIPQDRAARIIRQACASLSEAHEGGIIHRDLKPDNIFLTSLGREKDWVKVLDFGLAKLANTEMMQGITQQGKVFGTPRYMSPEQAQGLTLDARSDLYTLGVVLHELLTGQALFSADTMVALLIKHVSEPPPLLSSVRPDLHFDPALERVVQFALGKEPEDRYSTMEDLASALGPFAYPAARTQRPSQTPDAPPRLPPNRMAPAPPPEPETGELDGLLSEFLRDLTPLEHLVDESNNPFADFIPDGSEDSN